MEAYSLKLAKRPNYGIRIEGTEFNRRLCIANIIIGKESEALAGGEAADQEHMKRVAGCVAEVIDTENFTVNSVAYQNLIVHICIAVQRIRENCYVPLDEERQERIRRSKEYRIAQKITERLNQSFDIRFPDQEIAYIAIHLAGKRSLFLPEQERTGEAGSQVISEETWKWFPRCWMRFTRRFSSTLERPGAENEPGPAHRPTGRPASVQHEAEKSAVKGYQGTVSHGLRHRPPLVLHPDRALRA